MADNKILQFPNKLRNAIDEDDWHAFQGEFYLDCFFSHHGYPAESPDQLQQWLRETELYADLENPFFRGWLVRRLSEPGD